MVNRTLISFPGYAADATFAMITGTADPDFPVTKLADLKRIRQVFKAAGAADIAFKATFSADREIQFVALLHHNAINGATYRVRCYSDTSLSTLVDDSGTLAFSISSNAQFRAVTPYALPSAITVRAVRIDLSDMGLAWQIGGMEVAGMLAYEAVSRREIGVDAADDVTPHVEGVNHAQRLFSPRLLMTGRSNIVHQEHGWDAMDLAKNLGRSEPFVFVRAYEDATTWERENVLVRLRSMPRIIRGSGDLASFELPLTEHLR